VLNLSIAKAHQHMMIGVTLMGEQILNEDQNNAYHLLLS
jgi:hypothetical protein